MEKNHKILILVPAATARGGISNYYQVLKNEFSENIEYFLRGARTLPIRRGFWVELIRALKDYLGFKKRIRENNLVLVQSSTSLGLQTTIRDGLFLRYAKKRGLKTIVFFRGWGDSDVQKNHKYLKIFKYFFFGCNKIIVLSNNTKICLERWGYKGEVIVETTLVDRTLIATITKKQLIDKYEKIITEKKMNLLFLSRIERYKGIFELLEAFKILRQDFSSEISLTLSICGDGSELENIKTKVDEEGIQGVRFFGFVSGEIKRKAFEKAHLFIFPSHGEGMPNAVLEAMGFGLPVITTPVGGLKDFFINGKHGGYIEINNPKIIVEKTTFFAQDIELLKKISLNNHSLANELFRSDIVARRMERMFREVISGKRIDQLVEQPKKSHPAK